jgi:hypothetical protein
VTYVTAAQVKEAFARHLRNRLKLHRQLMEGARPVERAIASLTRAVERFVTWPSHQIGVVKARDTARLVEAVYEYGLEVLNNAVTLAMERAYDGVDLEDALGQLFNRALRQRRALPALGVTPQSVWTYGSADMPDPAPHVGKLADDPRTLAYLLHAKQIADASLRLLRQLQRCAGECPQTGYGSTKGPVMRFTYETLAMYLPMLLPGVEVLSAERVRKILEGFRTRRSSSGAAQ